MSFTTNPQPLIVDSAGTLTYIDYTYTPIYGNSYILRNSQNIQVPNSGTYTPSINSVNSINSNLSNHMYSSLTNDGNGNFYFGESSTGIIYTYNSTSDVISTFTTLPATGNISVTYYNGYLYAASLNANIIYQYDSSGNSIIFASSINIINPNGLIFDNLGNLYISNYGSSTIYKYTKSTDSYIKILSITKPYGLAFDSSSNLYIATWNENVYQYNFNTKILSIYFQDNKTVSGNVQGSQPYGIVFDNYDNLYVTSFFRFNIYKVLPDKSYSIILTSLTSRPTGITMYNNTLYFILDNDINKNIPWSINSYNLYLEFENLMLESSQNLSIYNTTNSLTVANIYVDVISPFITNPQPLITDSAGTLTYIDYTYAPIYGNSYILRNSQNIQVPNSTTYIPSIISFNNNSFTPVLSSLTTDGNGNFYFGEENTGNIYKYNSISNSIIIFTNIGQVYNSISLTYYNGYLYIGNWNTNTVDKYDSIGNFTVFASGFNTTQPTVSYIKKPNGLVFNNSGDLYISNSGFNTIIKYTKLTDTYVTILNITGPIGLALDSYSNLYIASDNLGYVYKYNFMTTTLSIYLDTKDSRPYGLVFDQYDNLYVTTFNNVYITKVLQDMTSIKLASSFSGRLTGLTIYNNNLYFLTNNNGTTSPWAINSYNLYLYFSNLILDTSQTLSIYNKTKSQTIANIYVEVDNSDNPIDYCVNNINLSSFFSPIPSGYSGPYAIETNLENNEIDLNKIFLPYTQGDTKAEITNISINGIDLNEIFKKI